MTNTVLFHLRIDLSLFQTEKCRNIDQLIVAGTNLSQNSLEMGRYNLASNKKKN